MAAITQELRVQAWRSEWPNTMPERSAVIRPNGDQSPWYSRTATNKTEPAAMLRDAAQRARIEKAERNEWRCAAPQHEGRSEIARCSQKNGPEPVHRSGLSDL